MLKPCKEQTPLMRFAASVNWKRRQVMGGAAGLQPISIPKELISTLSVERVEAISIINGEMWDLQDKLKALAERLDRFADLPQLTPKATQERREARLQARRLNGR